MILLQNRQKVSFPRKRESRKAIESTTIDYPVKPDNDKKVFYTSADISKIGDIQIRNFSVLLLHICLLG